MKAGLVKQDIPGLLIMAIIGIGLTFLGAVKIKNAAESKNWPVINGTVTRSEIGGAIKYYPSVSYTYTVDTVVYTSNSISNVNFNTKNRSVAEEVLKRYPLGSEIKVHYNSADPSKALLEPGVNSGNIILLAAGILLLALPILLVIFMKFHRTTSEKV